MRDQRVRKRTRAEDDGVTQKWLVQEWILKSTIPSRTPYNTNINPDIFPDDTCNRARSGSTLGSPFSWTCLENHQREIPGGILFGCRIHLNWFHSTPVFLQCLTMPSNVPFCQHVFKMWLSQSLPKANDHSRGVESRMTGKMRALPSDRISRLLVMQHQAVCQSHAPFLFHL